jgi:AcrR family transcriptional regulator
VAIGRPRAFDTDQALDQALYVFWEKGYEGTSIADLTEAMGINPPSLYAAFGNKETLFKKALNRYEARRDEIFEEAFAAPTAREAIERLLEGIAERLSGKDSPSGCLMVQAALCGGKDCDSVRKDLAARRAQGEILIRKRLERGKREGDLPKDADLVGLARYLATVMHGWRSRRQAAQAARSSAPSPTRR